MKICLVKPPILHKSASFALMPTPPLGLAYIAAALNKKVNHLKVIDASAEGVSLVKHFRDEIYVFGLNKYQITEKIDADTDVVCFSFMFTNNWLYGREVVKEVRKKLPKAILVAGGEHATAAPEYCMTQSPLDYIVLGEGEETIVELIDAIKKKKDTTQINGIAYRNGENIVSNKKRARIKAVKDIAWPAWEFFPLKEYFENKMTHGVYRGNTLPVMATRGCPYTCTFCSNPLMWGKAYEMRPPEDFVNELEYLHKTYDVVNFDLYDLTAIMYKDWIVAMCKEILKRDLKISYQLPSGTRAEAIDYEVADLLFKSGCINMTYAPESGSERVLKSVKKQVEIKKMLQSIADSNKAGMIVHLNMILGFPDDTHKDMWQTMRFLVKCSWYGAHDIAPAVFTPYPGSTLYNRLTKQGKLDIYDDSSIIDIINSYDLWPSKVFSEKMSELSIKLYVFLFTFAFYGSNYLFRPWRLLRTLRNLLINKHESRLEQILYKNFIKNFIEIFTVSPWIKVKLRLNHFFNSFF